MAAPSEITLRNLSGKYSLVRNYQKPQLLVTKEEKKRNQTLDLPITQNKSLSDDNDPVLKIQNVGFIQRKAIGAANLSLTITMHTDAATGHTHFDTAIRPSLGPASTEERVLAWDETPADVRHPLFGNGTARGKYTTLDDAEIATDEFLTKGWEEGTAEVIVMRNEMDSGVVTRLVHGFEVVKGERRYVRHVVSTNKKGESAKVRLVYDYEGSA